VRLFIGQKKGEFWALSLSIIGLLSDKQAGLLFLGKIRCEIKVLEIEKIAT
jgi:hypothetical protein